MLMTRAEAAQHLGVSVRTIDRRIRAGSLPVDRNGQGLLVDVDTGHVDSRHEVDSGGVDSRHDVDTVDSVGVDSRHDVDMVDTGHIDSRHDVDMVDRLERGLAELREENRLLREQLSESEIRLGLALSVIRDLVPALPAPRPRRRWWQRWRR